MFAMNYLPEENEILEHSGCHINTVQKSITQKQYKIFVVCEIHTIVNLKWDFFGSEKFVKREKDKVGSKRGSI